MRKILVAVLVSLLLTSACATTKVPVEATHTGSKVWSLLLLVVLKDLSLGATAFSGFQSKEQCDMVAPHIVLEFLQSAGDDPNILGVAPKCLGTDDPRATVRGHLLDLMRESGPQPEGSV